MFNKLKPKSEFSKNIFDFNDRYDYSTSNSIAISPILTRLYNTSVSVFLIGVFNLLNYFNNRMKEYKDLAKAKVYKSITMGIIQLSLEFLKAGIIWFIS